MMCHCEKIKTKSDQFSLEHCPLFCFTHAIYVKLCALYLNPGVDWNQTRIIDVSTTNLKWRLVATKGGKLRSVIMNNVIWTNKKTESPVYSWQCAHASFDVTCFPAFVGASDVILSVLSVHKLCIDHNEGLVQNYCNYLILCKELQ